MNDITMSVPYAVFVFSFDELDVGARSGGSERFYVKIDHVEGREIEQLCASTALSDESSNGAE